MSKSKSAWRKTFENLQTNYIVTCLIGAVTAYVTLVALFQRDPIHPLFIYVNGGDNIVPQATNNADFSLMANTSWSMKNATTSNRFVFPLPDVGGVRWRNDARVESPTRFADTLLSMFMLWALSQALGYASACARLPPLVGMLATGIIAVNAFHDANGAPFLIIHKSWATLVRQIAFILCVIRSGIGLDPKALRRCWKVSISLAIMSATVETIAIFFVGNVIYGLHAIIVVLFAYIMAANSPAVTIPLMLDLQAARRGTSKHIPTILLTGVAVDNVYCVMAYFAVSASIFHRPAQDSVSVVQTVMIVGLVIVQLVVGIFLGIFFGYMLRYFPRVGEKPTESPLHCARSLLLSTTCCALYFGAYALRCDVAAPAGVFAVSIVAAAGWKLDNQKRTTVEERVFKRLWDVIFLPLLFALTGALFHLSLFSWTLIKHSLITLCAGIIARVFSAFIVGNCFSTFNFNERIFLAVSFTPKATVQAVFLPLLVTLIADEGGDEATARYVASSCALSILVAAPIAHFFIERLGYALLTRNDHEDDDKHSNQRAICNVDIGASLPPERTEKTFDKREKPMISVASLILRAESV